jgi:hypothetical protein
MLAKTGSNLTNRMLREQEVGESAYRMLIGKPERKILLWRPKYRW